MADVVSDLSRRVDAYNAAQELGMELIKNSIKASKAFSQEAVMFVSSIRRSWRSRSCC